MRLLKTVVMISCVTIVSVLYVHQQVELVKLSYSIERKERIVKDMLDRNERLDYNIDNLEAPSRLEQALVAKNINVAFPKKGNVVKVARITPRATTLERLNSRSHDRRFNALGVLDFFSQSREAQAKED